MYEIQWGEDTEYRDGGNPYEPCMVLVREKVAEGEPLPADIFIVKALHADHPEEQEIGLGTIIQLLHMANEYPEDYEDDPKVI